jgi:hypothetical protein
MLRGFRLSMKLLVLVVLLVGCAEPRSLLVHRPEDPKADAAVTAMWNHEIHGVARDGDWLLTRSYYAVADAISLATLGEGLSHASIYDAHRDTVIEAVGDGVREIPLAQLLDRNHYVIVVRPSYLTAENQEAALAFARTQLGTGFDTGGMLGFDDPDKFYCSELVWWASRGEEQTGDHLQVVTPTELMNYGAVIYWSGKRTDPQVLELAVARTAS